MGIVIRQSLKSTAISYIGVAVAYLNLIVIFPYALDPGQIGVVRLVIEASVFFALFFQLGAPYLQIRFKPIFESQNKNPNNAFAGALIFGLVGALIFVACFQLLKPYVVEYYQNKSSLFENHVHVVGILTVIVIALNFFEKYAHSHKRIVVPNFFKEILIRIILGLTVLLYVFNSLTFDEVVVGILVAYGAALALMIGYSYQLKPFSALFDGKLPWAPFANYASFITVGAIGGGLVGKLDMLMLGTMSTMESLGIYSTMFFIVTVIELPKRAIMQISNPLVSEHLANDQMDELRTLYKKTSLNQVLFGSLVFLLIWINVDSLFLLMPKGEIFSTGKWVILIIGIAKLFDMLTGINGQILINSKFYRFSLIAIFGLGIMGFGTNYLLIPIFGMNGAATATLISVLVYNLTLVVFIYMKFKMHPFSFDHLKILLVIGITLGTIYLLPSTDNAFVNIGLSIVVCLAVFTMLAYKLKISTDFNNLARSLVGRLTGRNQSE